MALMNISDFVASWRGKGDEKQDTQRYWIDLLHTVLGVENPTKHLLFEKRVKLEDSTRYIDVYIPETNVLIEQKGSSIDLSKPELQSGGASLTPYNQARRYDNNLPVSEKARWIICCNFQRFEIHDMSKPLDEPEIILLEDLEKEAYRLQFLINTNNEHIKKELEVSLRAGEVIGEIYDALLKEYRNPNDPQTLKSLNVLCVRLVFCLYAEDSGLFGTNTHSAFHDYLVKFKPGSGNMRRALIDLFDILNTPVSERDPYLDDSLLAFPYVSGGLFQDKNIEIPRLNDEIATLILQHASSDFDWSQISPTIFGAVFESTLNPETRRSSGMHYTSVENIHKVIDPLFLNGLKEELAAIKIIAQPKEKIRKARAFQDKLASLKFLDPACGSGNFLTETFLSLRRLENEAIRIISQDNMIIGFEGDNSWIKVAINQFHGIEINDFAVATAMTALWIAEAQTMKETENIIHQDIDFFPLKSYTNIVEGNALKMDWNDLIPAAELDYIMGNPPFVGYSLQSKEQKEDILSIYVDEKGKPYKTAGKIDYVAGWYWKASEYIQNTSIRAALVSTNSITQGEQVASIWEPLYKRFGIHIDFAYRTFIWDSEASLKAHVHCVIIGFSSFENNRPRIIIDKDKTYIVDNINCYLIDASDVFINSNNKPISSGVEEMINGNKAADGGFLIFDKTVADEISHKDPIAYKYVKPFIGAREFINGEPRYCLWLQHASPADIRSSTIIKERVAGVKAFREASPKEATNKSADFPNLFQQIRQPDTNFILIPRVSSEGRKYIPIGFLTPDNIVSDAIQFIPDATLYHLGILTSSVHMAWTRVVCGRLKSDYRYSNDIVYNNFPWPTPTDAQKEKIEKTAQAILDARNLYPDCSLADLYDETTMPVELRRAHQENDKAVMEAYGFGWKNMTEADIVAALFKLYQELTQK